MRVLILVALCACTGEGRDDAPDVVTSTTLFTAVTNDADFDGFSDEDDCNDDDAFSFPGAPERCDGLDNDCDGEPESGGAVHLFGGPGYASLADAVAQAPAGGELVLCPATYEISAIVEKNLTLRSLGGQATLDAKGAGSHFSVRDAVLRLQGLKLVNGSGTLAGSIRQGGAVDGALGRVELIDCELTGNVSDDGGAVFVGPAGASMHSVVISDNIAAVRGGGVFSRGEIEIRDLVVRGNLSANDGGGLYLSNGGGLSGVELLVQGNTGEDGGGIYSRDGLFEVSNLHILGNDASGVGGGLSLVTGEVYGAIIESNAADQGGNLHILQGAVLQEVELIAGVSRDGGGMYASGDLFVSDLVATNNDAEASGGGVFLLQATMQGTSRLLNNSAQRGGGVSLVSGSLQGALLRDNFAEIGGGAYLSDAGELCGLEALEFFDNSSTDGAGMWSGVGFTATNLLFERNIASGRGGAIYQTLQSTSELTDVHLEANVAALRGGAFYLNSLSTVQFSGGTIVNNQALRGAGAYLGNGSVLNMSNSSMLNNGDFTTISGGGVRLTEGGFTATSCELLNNRPDDVFVYDGQEAYIYGAGSHTFSCDPALCEPAP